MSSKTGDRPEEDFENPEAWVDRYGDYLYRFALARVKDPSLSEDLVQETFLAALKGRKNFQRRSALQTWLTAILKHKIIDHLRRKNRVQPVEDIDAVGETVEGFFEKSGAWRIRPGNWDVNPGKILEQRQFMDTLYRCLSELPERLAKAFMLREMEGLSTEELCKSLDITPTNSWVMLFRARTYLRRCLEINWFEKTVSESS
jgi:RNA polymerase sigma-70 factor (ECF subfamily)